MTMEFSEPHIRQIVKDRLQPKVRVDGGDIEFEKLDQETIYLGAHADCAVCPASPERLQWWCEQEFEAIFGQKCHVVITNHVPYFE